MQKHGPFISISSHLLQQTQFDSRFVSKHYIISPSIINIDINKMIWLAYVGIWENLNSNSISFGSMSYTRAEQIHMVITEKGGWSNCCKMGTAILLIQYRHPTINIDSRASVLLLIMQYFFLTTQIGQNVLLAIISTCSCCHFVCFVCFGKCNDVEVVK